MLDLLGDVDPGVIHSAGPIVPWAQSLREAEAPQSAGRLQMAWP